MIEERELLRIWGRRIWRRRWLGLGTTYAICASGWSAVGLLAAPLAAAGLLLGLVLLAAAGGLVAALVAVREPVFDTIAELRRAFDRLVLGEVADLTPHPWQRATRDVPFALACLAPITVVAGLLLAQALG